MGCAGDCCSCCCARADLRRVSSRRGVQDEEERGLQWHFAAVVLCSRSGLGVHQMVHCHCGWGCAHACRIVIPGDVADWECGE